jgi:hypothetical protein
LFAVSEEWQAEERRARIAEIERVHRNEAALALAGYVSPAARLRSRVARLLSRPAKALVARIATGAPRAAAGQA